MMLSSHDHITFCCNCDGMNVWHAFFFITRWTIGLQARRSSSTCWHKLWVQLYYFFSFILCNSKHSIQNHTDWSIDIPLFPIVTNKSKILDVKSYWMRFIIFLIWCLINTLAPVTFPDPCLLHFCMFPNLFPAPIDFIPVCNLLIFKGHAAPYYFRGIMNTKPKKKKRQYQRTDWI